MTLPIADQNEFEAELIRFRRLFHRFPETGFTEFRTSARICEALSLLSCRIILGNELRDALTSPAMLDACLNPEAFAQAQKDNPGDKWIRKMNGIPGVVAIFKGKQSGSGFGFRFDMDGLPIKESRQASHPPFQNGFASENDNMHACGHDGHMTIGLGLAGLLSKHADDLKGEVYLMFQPAEEVIRGGKIYAGLKYIRDLNYFFSLHLGMSGPGKVTCGVSFFADRRFRVIFKGKGAHAGGAPHQGKNALLAACTAVTGLYGISRHAWGDSRINIGGFSSPNVVNIIPDHVEFELDLRAQTPQVMDYLTRQAENVIAGAALMQDVEHKIDYVTEAETAQNSGEMIIAVKKACLDIGMKKEDIIDRLQVSGSEDATSIMNQVLQNGGKTAYIGLGAPSRGNHHNENFDFDETDLSRGVNLLFQLMMNLSEQGAA